VGSFAILAGQSLIVIALVLFMFRLRAAFGLAPLYISLGVFQVLQTLTSTIFVEIGPGLMISTGSSVLFAASLGAVLLVYIREDALEARKLIYALVISNVTTGLLSATTAYQLRSGLALTVLNVSAPVFEFAAGMLVLGSFLLYVDALLIPVVYEVVARRLSGLFVSMLATMIIVLGIDSLVFVTTFFAREPNYPVLLASAIVGKSGFAVCFCACGAVYLRRLEREPLPVTRGPGVRDLFALLTYRQKFELLAEVAAHDGLTGVFNRAHFDDALERAWLASTRTGDALSLIMIDIDAFKAFNDRYGHREGDRCLRDVAEALRAAVRSGDETARYGGEEFAVLLPATDADVAEGIAESLRTRVAELGIRHEAHPVGRVTVSVGVATTTASAPLPPAQLVDRADQALYRAKAAGRNQVAVA
jgi:diguanylate cyclase (GGDEF)-like protein